MIMDCKSLMIGDWVKYTTPVYIKVASITKKKIGYHIKPNEPRMHYVRACEVEPIPLTPEILEKNGFVFKDGWDEWVHYSEFPFIDFTLQVDEDGFHLDLPNARITYLHELQHTLKLCGIKLNIEL